MIINADSILPHLKKKVRPMQSDDSRHLRCPACTVRTKLNILADGRRKCSVCGKKFRIHKVTEEHKLQQCAEILLCFCLDFAALKASQITHHRHRLVSAYYDQFRRLLAENSLPPEKVRLISMQSETRTMGENKSKCRWCNSTIRSGEGGKTPVFGIQFKKNGEVYIDPLHDDEAMLHFHTLGSKDENTSRREGYAGFICCSKFHRFVREKGTRDGAEELWTWIQERMNSHFSTWKRNTGFYLKELEWKYNNRELDPDDQAKKIIELMPMNFIEECVLKTDDQPEVQRSAEMV